MSLAAKFASGVETLFTAVGDLAVTATVRRVRPGEFDPVTGAPERIVEEWRDVPAIVTEYKAGEVDGERVRATDRRLLLKASTTLPEPLPGDLIVVGHESYTVIPPVVATRAGSTSLMYDCQGRV